MNYCSEVSHFSYKNTVLLIQLKKFKWLLLQEKCRVPRRREPRATSVAPQGHMPTTWDRVSRHRPCLPPSVPGLLCLQHTPLNQQQQLPCI